MKKKLQRALEILAKHLSTFHEKQQTKMLQCILASVDLAQEKLEPICPVRWRLLVLLLPFCSRPLLLSYESCTNDRQQKAIDLIISLGRR